MLTNLQIEFLIQLINSASFRGDIVEFVHELKLELMEQAKPKGEETPKGRE